MESHRKLCVCVYVLLAFCFEFRKVLREGTKPNVEYLVCKLVLNVFAVLQADTIWTINVIKLLS